MFVSVFTNQIIKHQIPEFNWVPTGCPGKASVPGIPGGPLGPSDPFSPWLPGKPGFPWKSLKTSTNVVINNQYTLNMNPSALQNLQVDLRYQVDPAGQNTGQHESAVKRDGDVTRGRPGT